MNTAKEAKEQRRGEGGRGEEVKERTLMIRGICIRGQCGEKKGEEVGEGGVWVTCE